MTKTRDEVIQAARAGAYDHMTPMQFYLSGDARALWPADIAALKRHVGKRVSQVLK